MTPTLHIRLLGAFQIRYDGEPLTGLHSTRVQELFAYLVLHAGTPLPRQHVAFQFWPDSTEGQARTNLRKVLHSLRQYLPDAEKFLQVTPATIEWLTDSGYTLDVAEITQLLQEAEKDPLDTERLMAAVDRYGGELLPGSYEEWLLARRNQLERAILAALQKLVTLLENRRAYDEGIRYAQRLVELDPLREQSYRQLMRLHALAGQRAQAIRVYHDCAAILRRELEVEPGPELTLAYQQLSEAEPQAHEPDALSLSPAEASDLVGREREWEALRSIWEQALRGTAQMVVITGEAGFGKTRLAEEILHWASRLGAVTARTRSFASHSALVYAPVAELLRQEALNRRLATLDDVWLQEIARLLPELVESGKVASLPQPMTESWQQQRLLQALVRAVIAENQPILLLFDDLQWCDQETLRWLQYLLHEKSQARLLIVGTARSEEVHDQHPYTTLQMDLTHAGKFTEIPVALLDRAKTLSLASHIAGRQLTPQQAESIWEIALGNPLFVVETVRYWMDEGSGTRDKDEDPPASSTVSATRLPPKVYSVIRSRLMQLSPAAREVISLAATVGRSFAYPVLAAAAQLHEYALVDSLDEVLEKRIVMEQGDVYDFSHDRLRDVAYAEVSRTRRRLLHGRVAAAIESVQAHNLDEVAGELAHHHEQAGNLAQAAEYLRRAGERVAAQFANDEAIAYFTRALALVPEIDTKRRLDLLLQRETLYMLQTNIEKRREDLQEIQQLSEALVGDPDEVNLYRAQVGIRWARFVGYQGDYPEAIRLAEETIALAQAANAPEIEMECYWHWGRELWAMGRFDEVKQRLKQGLRIAETLGADDKKADMLTYLAAADFFTGAPTSRVLEQFQQCLVIYTSTRNLIGQADSHDRLGFVYTHRNEDLAAAKEHFDQALRIMNLTGDREWWDVVGANIGYLSICEGDYATSERTLTRTVQRAREVGHQFRLGIDLSYLAYSCANRGDYGAAATYFEEGLQVMAETGVKHFLAMAQVFYGRYHLYAGNLLCAERAARTALAMSREIDDVARQGEAFVCLGHALAAQDRLDEAAEAYTQGLALHRQLERTRRSLEALAGLALVADRKCETDRSLSYVEEILQDLTANQAIATEESFRVYLTCYRLLHQQHDARAEQVLKLAYEQLQKRAASLANAEHQQLFWDMPGHREIERDWHQLNPA